MKDHDKSQTIHIPTQGTPGEPRRGANLDDVATQVQLSTAGRAVGRLTIVEGPGAGEVRAVYNGTNSVGRYEDNIVSLDFGDNSISRHQHAVINCSDKDRSYRILDGGKPNPVLVNGAKVLPDHPLKDGDLVKIGMTTMRFNIA